MKLFIFNLVNISVVEVLVGVILPEGKMRGFILSTISFFSFYCVAISLCQMIKLL